EFRVSFFREGQGKFDTPTNTTVVQNSCGTGSASAYCFTGTTDQPLLDSNLNQLTAGNAYGIYPNLGATKEGLPYISVGGGFSLGNNSEGQLPQTGNTIQFADNFSKLVGNHSFKFGADIRYQMFNQFLYYDVNGLFNFTSGGVNDTGDNYANFLLGLPN